MVRLNNRSTNSRSYYYIFLLAWQVRRFASRCTKKHGMWLWFLVFLLFINVIAGGISHFQELALKELRASLVHAKKLQTELDANQHIPSGNESNIKSFENLLLPHEDIPDLVRSVLQIAEDEGLTMERGDYQVDIDQQGRFARYKMNLPVKGRSTSIYRFMRSVLVTHANVTLDGLQFKREIVGSEKIDAKIQWIVLTRIPLNEGGNSPAGVKGIPK